MKDILKIGLIIADNDEYAGLLENKNITFSENNYYNRIGHTFQFKKDDKTIKVISLYCGIGTVNATAAAMKLAMEKVDVLLNYGLSGGISGVCKGDYVVATSFLEHDFDLTCLGYKMCEKPNQNYIYSADNRLVNSFLNTGSKKKIGKTASGDKFVSDPILRDKLKDDFSINCCDMETSAIAYVANLTNIPFASLRKISDDAGDDATSSYREVNSNVSFQSSLAKEVITMIESLFSCDSLWEK